MAGNFGQLPPADQHGDEPDRNIDDEYPAPVHRHQQSADDGSERRSEAADRGPGPHRRATMLGRKHRQQQAQRGRRHQRRARRLQHTKGNQHLDIVGRGTGGRRRSEQRDTEQKTQIPAIAFGEPSEEHQKRSVGDRIAV